MTDHKLNPVALDPWAASSLLQKAIRRGETGLAMMAARALYRYRGKAIWSRFLTIALEDVGIGSPNLVGEVAGLAYDANLRSILGSDVELIDYLCRKLADAPKDRSSDYLYSIAVRHRDSGRFWPELASLPLHQRIEVAADPDQPLPRRAVATLLAVTRDGLGAQILKGGVVREFLSAFDGQCRPALMDAVRAYASRGGHPFGLMLPILWSELSATHVETSVQADEVPTTAFVGGIPLYTFDTHTAVGKRAITIFAQQNPAMVQVLKQVPADHRRGVALIAAFYADAVPISRRFLWGESEELERLGFEADMILAGCPVEALFPVLDCVRANLSDLNRTRRAALGHDHDERNMQSIAQAAERSGGSQPWSSTS